MHSLREARCVIQQNEEKTNMDLVDILLHNLKLLSCVVLLKSFKYDMMKSCV